MKYGLISIATVSVLEVGAAYGVPPDDVRSALRNSSNPDKLISDTFRAGAESYAKSLPARFDEETELTGVSAIGKSLNYFVRLVKKEKIDIPDVDELRQKIAARNAPPVCTAPRASIFINEYGAQYKYIVYTKSREYLFEYVYNRSTCATYMRK